MRVGPHRDPETLYMVLTQPDGALDSSTSTGAGQVQADWLIAMGRALGHECSGW